MARRKLTVDRYAEIERRLAEGRGVREIARALGCSRRLVREIRSGLKGSPAIAKPLFSRPRRRARLRSAVTSRYGLLQKCVASALRGPRSQ